MAQPRRKRASSDLCTEDESRKKPKLSTSNLSPPSLQQPVVDELSSQHLNGTGTSTSIRNAELQNSSTPTRKRKDRQTDSENVPSPKIQKMTNKQLLAAQAAKGSHRITSYFKPENRDSSTDRISSQTRNGKQSQPQADKPASQLVNTIQATLSVPRASKPKASKHSRASKPKANKPSRASKPKASKPSRASKPLASQASTSNKSKTDPVNGKRKRRHCGKCENCTKKDCGICKFCK